MPLFLPILYPLRVYVKHKNPENTSMIKNIKNVFSGRVLNTYILSRIASRIQPAASFLLINGSSFS